MFHEDDTVEAIEGCDAEQGRVSVGDRFKVAQVSASGSFVRFFGAEAWVSSHRFKKVGISPGGCAPIVGVEG